VSPAGRGEHSGPTDGFTLLETVCVMAIIAMIAAFALPTPFHGTSHVGVQQLAMRVASLLEADRYAAIRRRSTVSTSVDVRARLIRSSIARRDVAIPRDVDFRANVSSDCQSRKDGASVDFYADGRSCGGVLAFNEGRSGYEIKVNWLTGGVEVVAIP
jgi:general secretion pathway protein H